MLASQKEFIVEVSAVGSVILVKFQIGIKIPLDFGKLYIKIFLDGF